MGNLLGVEGTTGVVARGVMAPVSVTPEVVGRGVDSRRTRGVVARDTRVVVRV